MKPEHDIAPITLAELRTQGIYFVREPDGAIGLRPLPGHSIGEDLLVRIAASWQALGRELLAELESELKNLEEE